VCRLSAVSVACFGAAILAANILKVELSSLGAQDWLGASPSVGPLFLLVGIALLHLHRHLFHPRAETSHSHPDALLLWLWAGVVLAGLWQTGVVVSGRNLGLPFWDRTGDELSVIVGFGTLVTGSSVYASFFSRRARFLTAWLAIGMLLGATLLLLGYWYNVPFFYTGPIAPVGLITLCGVALVGACLVSAYGPGCWPLNLFAGPGMQARLMRLFVPLTLLLLTASDMIAHTARNSQGFHPALLDVSLLLAGLMVIGIAVGGLASHLGREIDQAHQRERVAEGKLRALNARLEEHIAQRTEELRRANASLSVALGEMHQIERELMELTAREHARIGRDLHDSVGQVLVAIGFLSKGLEEKLTAGYPLEATSIAQIRTLAIMALAEVRQISAGFYPAEIAHRGLAFALEQLAATISRTFGVECSFRPEHGAEEVAAPTAIQLYRIAQEAISNAMQHSRPREITVSLRCDAAGGRMAIWNDGHQFDLSSAQAGAGLNNMNHRAHAIGGELVIHAPDGSCFEIICNFPLPFPHQDQDTRAIQS
jgi:signal transduction histidine kinase